MVDKSKAKAKAEVDSVDTKEAKEAAMLEWERFSNRNAERGGLARGKCSCCCARVSRAEASVFACAPAGSACGWPRQLAVVWVLLLLLSVLPRCCLID